MKTRPNLRNFVYLAGSGLAIQLIGTVYRIWLARRIGAAGLGIFGMTYPVYRLLSSIATIGLPLALTKWVSEYWAAREYSEIHFLKNWAIRIAFTISLFAAGALYLAAPYLSNHLFSEPRVKEAFQIIALAIPFSALSSIYRGYFQGFSLMAPTALSEVNEQVAEVTTTVLGLSVVMPLLSFAPYSYPILGLTLGEIACWLTLIYFLKRRPAGLTSEQVEVVSIPRIEILHYSWPLLLNQIVVSVSGASEGVLIPRFLIQAGHTAAHSTQFLGFLNGMAAPIAYFPLILLFPLGAVLSPQVSAGFKSGSLPQLRVKIRRFYLATTATTMVSFLTILFNAAPLAQTLYKTSIPVELIKILAVGMPFTALSILNSSILAATGATQKILTISLWSVGLKTALLFITVYWGINGAAWAITITQIFASLTSTLELRSFFTKLDA